MKLDNITIPQVTGNLGIVTIPTPEYEVHQLNYTQVGTLQFQREIWHRIKDWSIHSENGTIFLRNEKTDESYRYSDRVYLLISTKDENDVRFYSEDKFMKLKYTSDVYHGKAWEDVTEDAKTKRLSVPGGYIYKHSTYDKTMAMVFVPFK